MRLTSLAEAPFPVTWGLYDTVSPPRVADYVWNHYLMPKPGGNRLCYIPDANHYLRVDRPDAFVKARPHARGRGEQRPAVLAAEHAGEASPAGVNGAQHLAAFPDPHAALAGNDRGPHGAARIGADAVGRVPAARDPGIGAQWAAGQPALVLAGGGGPAQGSGSAGAPVGAARTAAGSRVNLLKARPEVRIDVHRRCMWEGSYE